MIDQIQKVLDDWDYNQGLQILRSSGTKDALVKLLESGETVFFRKKLIQELKELMNNLVAQRKTAIENPDDGPLQHVIIKRNTAVRRQDYLRGQLPLLIGKKPAEVYPVCAEILDLDDTINEQWKIIYHFREHGELPPDEAGQIIQKAATWLDLVRIHSSYKTNVSKARNGKLPEVKLGFYQEVVDRCEKLLKQPIS